MADKTILIIGAGVAGLCAGIYGQMNGYRTRIIEMHDIPGGLCTAWKRHGYLIDGCIHFLVGSGAGVFHHRYWQEVGLLEGREFYQHDRYMTLEGKDGRVFNLYTDPDRLEKHMLELSPGDAAAIKELCDGLRFGMKFQVPPYESYEMNLLDQIKMIFSMLPVLGGLSKWPKVTIGDMADRFQDPLLREALHNVLLPEFAMLYMLTNISWVQKKQAGYPQGGSLPLAMYLERRYKSLGGQVQYRARVEKILVEDGRAVGVRLADGAEQRADFVVSAADGYATIFKMLDGKFVDDTIRGYYDHFKVMPPLIYIGLGVNRAFPDVAPSVEGTAIELPEPVTIAGEAHRTLAIRVSSYDPSLAPAGKSVLIVTLMSNYAWWKALEQDRVAYEQAKAEILEQVLTILERRFPGLRQQVEMCDVASPLTYERYTGNWQGSFEGWVLTPEQGMVKMRNSLPGLRNFWMAGQWIQPGGGLPAGISTGRAAIWQVCKQDGKKFRPAK